MIFMILIYQGLLLRIFFWVLGFYSALLASPTTVLTSVLRYRVNYYATIIHYIFFEQELIIAFLLLFNYSSVVNEVLIVLLLSVLYIDCDLIITITYTNSYY